MKRKQAFTLLEVIFALILVGIFVSIFSSYIYPIFTKKLNEGKVDKYIYSLKELKKAILAYKLDKGTFPSSIEELVIYKYINKIPAVKINNHISIPYLSNNETAFEDNKTPDLTINWKLTNALCSLLEEKDPINIKCKNDTIEYLVSADTILGEKALAYVPYFLNGSSFLTSNVYFSTLDELINNTSNLSSSPTSSYWVVSGSSSAASPTTASTLNSTTTTTTTPTTSTTTSTSPTSPITTTSTSTTTATSQIINYLISYSSSSSSNNTAENNTLNVTSSDFVGINPFAYLNLTYAWIKKEKPFDLTKILYAYRNTPDPELYSPFVIEDYKYAVDYKDWWHCHYGKYLWYFNNDFSKFYKNSIKDRYFTDRFLFTQIFKSNKNHQLFFDVYGLGTTTVSDNIFTLLTNDIFKYYQIYTTFGLRGKDNGIMVPNNMQGILVDEDNNQISFTNYNKNTKILNVINDIKDYWSHLCIFSSKINFANKTLVLDYDTNKDNGYLTELPFVSFEEASQGKYLNTQDDKFFVHFPILKAGTYFVYFVDKNSTYRNKYSFKDLTNLIFYSYTNPRNTLLTSYIQIYGKNPTSTTTLPNPSLFIYREAYIMPKLHLFNVKTDEIHGEYKINIHKGYYTPIIYYLKRPYLFLDKNNVNKISLNYLFSINMPKVLMTLTPDWLLNIYADNFPYKVLSTYSSNLKQSKNLKDLIVDGTIKLGTPIDFAYSDNGKVILVLDDNNNLIIFKLTKPFDLSTIFYASYVNIKNAKSVDIRYNVDTLEYNIYVLLQDGTIYRYKMSEVSPLNFLTPYETTITGLTNAKLIRVNDDGSRLAILAQDLISSNFKTYFYEINNFSLNGIRYLSEENFYNFFDLVGDKFKIYKIYNDLIPNELKVLTQNTLANGYIIFDFYDDFNDNYWQDKYELTHPETGYTVTEKNGILTITTNEYHYHGIITKNNVSLPNNDYIIEFFAKTYSYDAPKVAIWAKGGVSNKNWRVSDTYPFLALFHICGSKYTYTWTPADTSLTYRNFYDNPTTSYHKYHIHRNSEKGLSGYIEYLYLSKTYLGENKILPIFKKNAHVIVGTNDKYYGNQIFIGGENNGNIDYDWVRVRKYGDVTVENKSSYILVKNNENRALKDFQIRVNLNNTSIYSLVIDSDTNKDNGYIGKAYYCYEKENGECVGLTYLSFSIPFSNYTSNTIWIKVPEIPAKGTVYIYDLNGKNF